MGANPGAGQVAFRCVHCQAKGLKKLSLLYLQGTSRSNSFVFGFYRGFKGNFWANALSTRQSLLARRAAPPQKKSLWGFLVIWAVLSGLFCLIGFAALTGRDSASLSGEAVVFVWLAIIAAGGIWRFKVATGYNTEVWSKEYARWQRSYLCMQCGTVNIAAR
jgi:DNA-directed RNA polymerase subunit RPC12/RpoP